MTKKVLRSGVFRVQPSPRHGEYLLADRIGAHPSYRRRHRVNRPFV